MSTVDKINWLFLVVSGGIIHLVMDWFAQNHWQATNKMKRRTPSVHTLFIRAYNPRTGVYEGERATRWWDRDKAAYAHAGLHFLPLLLVFPLWAAFIIAALHLLIDTRSPLEWWGKFTRQTVSQDYRLPVERPNADGYHTPQPIGYVNLPPTMIDVGKEVGFWRDQTAHILVIALVALVCVL